VDLAFRNSFNNGVAVFVPASRTGRVSLSLQAVAIEGARFHGLLFDGQHTTGLNTDDVLHPFCFDPHPVDSPASLGLELTAATIRGNGTLAGGFDTGTEFEQDGETFLTGCPADFDGVRVDEGGPGGIAAVIAASGVQENLADGVELDESEEGDVWATLTGVTITGNGETGTVDLDDGFDVDEAGDGDLNVLLVDATVNDNRDEGLDFDEAGAGSVSVMLLGVEASGNEDEGFKIDEEDDGDLTSYAVRATINGSLSQQGVELVEAGTGDFGATFVDSTITGNDDEGLAAEQVAPGVGTLRLVGSDLTGNGDPSLDLSGITLENVGSLLD
jgi:hypothetical protein